MILYMLPYKVARAAWHSDIWNSPYRGVKLLQSFESLLANALSENSNGRITRIKDFKARIDFINFVRKNL
jgi:hypothetical protein